MKTLNDLRQEIELLENEKKGLDAKLKVESGYLGYLEELVYRKKQEVEALEDKIWEIDRQVVFIEEQIDGTIK